MLGLIKAAIKFPEKAIDSLHYSLHRHEHQQAALERHADAELLETPKDLIKRCAVEVLEAYDPTERGRSSQADFRFEHGKMMIKQWQTSNTILIAFAGTKDITDAAVDLLAYASPPVGSKSLGGKGHHVIHTGFEKEWHVFKAELVNQMTESGSMLHLIMNSSTTGVHPTIVCCGHSLGGAIATLCTARIKEAYAEVRPRMYCVTFGSPRVGCEGFLGHYHQVMPLQNHFRVEGDGDPITKIPSGMQNQYRHVGQKVSTCKVEAIDQTWRQVRLHHGTEQPKDVNFGECLWNGSIFKMHNHEMVKYAKWMHEAEWLDEFQNPRAEIMPGGESLTRQLDGGSIMTGG